MSENMKGVLRYVAILLFLLLIAVALAGCGSTNREKPNVGNGAVMGQSKAFPGPIALRPVVEGGGVPVAVAQDPDGDGEYEAATLIGYQAENSQVDGMLIGSDDVAMQMGLMAQGLPTENWFQAILPDLFGPNIEEVRSQLIMYGAQLQMWALTVVEIGSFEVSGSTIRQTLLNGDEVVIETPTFKTPEIRFPTSQPPEPPKTLSGLQRLGVGGSEILAGLVSFFAYNVAKEPTIIETPPAQIVEVPTPFVP